MVASYSEEVSSAECVCMCAPTVRSEGCSQGRGPWSHIFQNDPYITEARNHLTDSSIIERI